MKKFQLLILIINLLLLIIISINPIFAVIESENYRIQKESINSVETGQQIDPYQVKSKQTKTEETKSKKGSEKGSIAGLQLIGFQPLLRKIILLGLAGIFFVVIFFVWLKCIFKSRKKTYNE